MNCSTFPCVITVFELGYGSLLQQGMREPMYATPKMFYNMVVHFHIYQNSNKYLTDCVET